MSRIVVTGLGILSAAGRGLPTTVEALREGRSALGALTRFPSPRNGHLPVAEVDPAHVRLAEDTAHRAAPATLAFARVALRDALAHADLPLATAGTVGLALGTCVGGMPETEAALAAQHAGDAFDLDVLGRHECGFVSHELAAELDLTGPVTTLSTACSSSAQAIATAADLIAVGAADVMLAGGADPLCRLTLNGFASLLNVSAEGCRPFDAERAGMSLGEGAAFLVLEREDAARARGARPWSVLAGHGNSCDAHHATAPHPEGLGAEAAMRGALEMADIAPTAVGYVNAHGTGTRENDAAEGRALQRVFGDGIAVSSTKRVFGHTLGAAGAIEAVATILAMHEGFLPGTPGLETPDTACGISPLQRSIDATPKIAISNSFGFGGNNSCLCFARPEASA